MIRPQNCPICRRKLPVDATASRLFPFCSQRCRDIDLLRWCDGRYAIAEPLDPQQVAAEEEFLEGPAP
jgi:hypothetical protein